MSFAKMKAMINNAGGTIRGTKIKDGQRLMFNQLKTDPSYQEAFFLWEFGKDEDINVPIKTFNEKHSEAAGFTRQFNCLICDRLEIGDVLHDQKEDLYWIVYESYNRDDILCAGLLKRLNVWIRWQDATGKIFDYPVFDVNATQYNSGTTESKTTILGTTQHQLTITADENTIMIPRDKRIFLDRNKVTPTVFKISQNDTTAYEYDKGILKITVSEDEYNSDTDNIDLWICDYWDPTPPPSQPIEITYAGESIIRVGSRKKFSVDGTAVTFSLENDPVLDDKLTLIVIDDYSCRVTVDSDQRIINKTFKVIATDDSGNKGEVEIEISGGV